MREGILMCLVAQTGIFIWKYFRVVRTYEYKRETENEEKKDVEVRLALQFN